ncbi:MAG: energy transducer TonB [Reyranella sp.]|nr:energy transducer TonB [Reyranella sp.]
MALSFALHGLALVPLLFAGASGSAPAEDPAILVEISLAAPAPTPESAIDVPTADPPPPVEAGEIAPTAVELQQPDEPPPLDTADLKPIEPPLPPKPQPKPQAAPAPQAKPAPPRPASKPAVTQTATAPDAGTAQITQTAAAAPPSAIVWEHHPRFRVPPRPAVYPPRAIELGHQGEALVRVRLEPDGSAGEIVLWRGSGFDLLDKAALAAVRGWQFMPAMRNGHAVAAWVEIPVRFHLR